MSTCCNPPVNYQPSNAQQDDSILHRETKPDLDFSESREMLSGKTPVTIGALRHLNKQMEKLKNRMTHLERQVRNALPEIAKSIPDMPGINTVDNLKRDFNTTIMEIQYDYEKRIESLNKTFNNVLETYHRDFNGRLRKLEEHKNLHDYIPLSAEHSERIKQLEKDIKYIHSALNAQIGISRQPYKCPVCYGCGEWNLESLEEVVSNGGCKVKQCHTCEGKGIVWG